MALDQIEGPASQPEIFTTDIQFDQNYPPFPLKFLDF